MLARDVERLGMKNWLTQKSNEKKEMDIQIFSAENAAKELKQHSKRWHVVSLRDVKYNFGSHPLNGLHDHAKDMIVVGMDDVTWSTSNSQGYTKPSREKVQHIIDWVEEKQPENLMVHCWAGVSRSSATAFLLSCIHNTPEEAFNLLNPKKHMPNLMIMDYGLDILNDTKATKWYRKFIQLQSQ
jgi:predicted protein tyrosine phosphatase